MHNICIIFGKVSLALNVTHDVNEDCLTVSARYKIPGYSQKNLAYHTDNTWFLIMTETVGSIWTKSAEQYPIKQSLFMNSVEFRGILADYIYSSSQE